MPGAWDLRSYTSDMPEPHEIPARLREYLKQRLSPAEYAAYVERREKSMDRHVEKILEDYERNQEVADLTLHLELHGEQIREELQQKDLTDVVDLPPRLAESHTALREAWSDGRVRLNVEPHHRDRPPLTVTVDLPEGNVRETLPMKPQLQQVILHSARGKQHG